MKARISPDTGQWEYSDGGQLRKGWLQFVNVPRPTHTASKVSEKVNPTISGNDAVETWVVRPKTEVELDEEDDKAERQAIRAICSDIKAGTGTNADRIARLEKAVVMLIHDMLN